jgi:hypothetical protein
MILVINENKDSDFILLILQCLFYGFSRMMLPLLNMLSVICEEDI